MYIYTWHITNAGNSFVWVSAQCRGYIHPPPFYPLTFPISYGFWGQIISPFYGPLKYKSSSKLNSSHPRTLRHRLRVCTNRIYIYIHFYIYVYIQICVSMYICIYIMCKLYIYNEHFIPYIHVRAERMRKSYKSMVYFFFYIFLKRIAFKIKINKYNIS